MMVSLDLGFINIVYKPPVVVIGNVHVDLSGAYIVWQMLNNADQGMSQITQQVNSYTISISYNTINYKFELSINGQVIELTQIEVYVLAHYLGRLLNFGIFLNQVIETQTHDQPISTGIQSETLNQPEMSNQYNGIQQQNAITNETNSLVDIDVLIEKFHKEISNGSNIQVGSDFVTVLKQITDIVPPNDTLLTYLNQASKVILGEIPVVFNEQTVASVQDENIKQLLAQLLTKYSTSDPGMKKVITGLVYFIEKLITFKSMQSALGSVLPS